MASSKDVKRWAAEDARAGSKLRAGMLAEEKRWSDPAFVAAHEKATAAASAARAAKAKKDEEDGIIPGHPEWSKPFKDVDAQLDALRRTGGKFEEMTKPNLAKYVQLLKKAIALLEAEGPNGFAVSYKQRLVIVEGILRK